jgi:chitodextrinase
MERTHLWKPVVLLFAVLAACGGSPSSSARNLSLLGDLTAAASSDLNPPSAPSNLSYAADGMTVTLAWGASTDDVGVTGYDLSYGSFFLGTFGDTSVALIGFKAATPYDFTVRARDAAGNVSVASNQITVLLSAGNDTTPPTAPTNLTAANVTSTSVFLRWTASTDDRSVVVYQIYAGTTNVGTAPGSTSATISNLKSGTAYVFTVTALDAAGNVSPSSAALSVTTLNAADTVPPSAPTNLTASNVTGTSVTLSWSASTDNVAVTSYTLYSGSAIAATTPGLTAAVSGLSPGTVYSFTVMAKDAAGNTSSSSSALSVTTTASQGISINVGGPAIGAFLADADYSGGTTYSTTNAIDTSALSGTAPPAAIFQSERYGEFTYAIPSLTAGGAYTVTLYFAETYLSSAGQRMFDVLFNGTTALSAFDIFAAAGGQNKAVAQSFNTNATAGGQISIQFIKGTGGVENPKVCGIAIAPGSLPTYPLSVIKSGTGSGAVSGGGIDCGATCSANVVSGSSVTLTASPASGSSLTSWGGACSGSSSTCTVRMTSAQSVTATFGASPPNPKIMGVNWADQRDNFVNGVLYISGLGSSDTYSSAATVASRIIGQMYAITGANAVRIPINEPTVSSYWSTYTGAIDTALTQGKVIMAYWAYTGGMPTDTNAFYTMWDKVVAKYVGNDNAYFEVINEPSGYSASDLTNLYNTWLGRYPNVPRGRVILDGAGLAQDVSSVGKDSRLDGTLLAVHDYSFFAGYESETEWANHIASYIGGYASRTVATEWGGPMGPGSKNGVNYDTIDYSIPSGSFFADYIRGVSSELHTLGMGSVYWPGLRDGDWYSMTTKTGTGSSITLSLVNASGVTRLHYAWGIGDGGGTYVQIRNKATSLYLDGMGSASGADAGQSTTTTSTNAQWVIENSGSYVRIRNRATGLYLDGMGRASGANLAQSASSTSNNQQWSVTTDGDYVTIRNRASSLYLDGMGRTTSGSAIVQGSSSTSANQRWKIVAAP